MVATSTVLGIVTVLLAINVIWLVYILIRGYTESLPRTIVFIIILGIIFGYLQNTELKTLSFRAIKNDLFPPNIPRYSYTVQEMDTMYSHKVIYTFQEPLPPLKLDMDPNGKTFTINDPESVNLVLDQLNLPHVKGGAKELSTITGNLTDVGIYRWNNYEKGTLILERGLYQNKNTMQSYNGIVRITIDSQRY